MPNIQQYQAPLDLTLQPNDMAAGTAREAGMAINRFAMEGGRALGGGIEKVGRQAGDALDRAQTMKDVSHGAVNESNLFGQLTGIWNKTATGADLNDTSIQQGFSEKVLEPSLEKFTQSFENSTPAAQEWAMRRADAMRQHFMQKTSADMGIRGADAAHQNIQNDVINYSNAVANDPTALEHTVAALKDHISTQLEQNPYLDAAGKAHINNELVPKAIGVIAKSAGESMARSNPKAYSEALNRGDFDKYFNGEEKAQQLTYADRMAHAQRADQLQQEHDERVAAQEKSQSKIEAITQNMYDPMTGRMNRPSPKLNMQIMSDPDILPKDRTAAIRWNQTQYKAQEREDKINAAGPPAKDDPEAYSSLQKRIGDADNPVTKSEIVDAVDAGKLTVKTAHDFAWRVSQKDADWNAVQKPFLNQFNNLKHIALNSFTSNIKYDEPAIQLGKLNQIESDAQMQLRKAYQNDRANINDYLDPQSPKYVLKGAISQLSTNPKQSMGEQADKLRDQNKDSEFVMDEYKFPNAAAMEKYKSDKGK